LVRAIKEANRTHGNRNSVYPEPSEKACMEVARTADGYFVGVSGCLERTWSPEGGYSDAFVPLSVLNLCPA
jgi:hypothetical protein